MNKINLVILILMLILNPALTTTPMAKTENWHLIHRNIIVPKWESNSTMDIEIMKKIDVLERELSLCRKQLKRCTEVYAPDRHPLFEKQMLRVGRTVTLADCSLTQSRVMERSSTHIVEFIDEINSLQNIVSDDTLSKIDYDGEKYRRVTLMLCDEKEILRISGAREQNI